ncbi:MAG TPA: HlyD family efflux transporter periplasmic adaptor subunit [Saprospiraceae bacterium]|nr:HlyD family efflux transporter periplasmic adaptor subunit [Saprospiraceae bacterium]
MRYLIITSMALFFFACTAPEENSDAYGNFEANPVLVSAEAKGKLLFLNATEGQSIQAGQLIGLIDTTALHLQKALINAQIGTLPQKLKSALSEIEVLKRQKANLEREKERIERLLADQAATPQQLDNISGEIEVLEEKIASLSIQTQIANRAILAEKQPLLAQRDIINDQIRRAYVYSPFTATVLAKLAEATEMVHPGMPLLRIADLDTIRVQFYVSGIQLQDLKLGQKIEVLVDEGTEELRAVPGRISRIAEQAEFTPKTIQTKEDRVHLVYAIEAKVPNADGRLKIGMPAEVKFTL